MIMSQVVVLWTVIVLLLVAALVLEAVVEFGSGKKRSFIDFIHEEQLLFCPGDHKEGSEGDF